MWVDEELCTSRILFFKEKKGWTANGGSKDHASYYINKHQHVIA